MAQPLKTLVYRFPRLYDLISYKLIFPWLGMGASQQTQLVRDTIRADGRLLEAPIGSGVLTLDLYAERPALVVVGVDLSLPMLRRVQAQALARGLGNIHLVCADMTVLPFANDSFSQMVTLNGLHLLPQHERGIDELWRVAEDGAALAGTVGVDIRGEPRGGLQQLLARLGLITPLNAEALHELLGLTWSKLKAYRSGAIYAFQRPKLDRTTGAMLPD